MPTLLKSETRERLVQLPRSSARSEQLTFLKLLTRVDAEASNGFGFEGTVLKPGARIAEAALWPTKKHPRVPVLLEYAGAANRSGEKLYVLWRYEHGAFVEIGRAVGLAWEWAVELRGPAVHALAQSEPRAARPNLERIAARLGAMLDHALAPLDPADRAIAVGLLHDRFAGEQARTK